MGGVTIYIYRSLSFARAMAKGKFPSTARICISLSLSHMHALRTFDSISWFMILYRYVKAFSCAGGHFESANQRVRKNGDRPELRYKTVQLLVAGFLSTPYVHLQDLKDQEEAASLSPPAPTTPTPAHPYLSHRIEISKDAAAIIGRTLSWRSEALVQLFGINPCAV